jgi:omega-amidase
MKKFIWIFLIVITCIVLFAQNSDYVTSEQNGKTSYIVKDDKQKVKVAAAQILTNYDIFQNREKIIKFINEAHKLGCEIILFHEGCLTGYPNKDQLDKIDFEMVRTIEKEIRDMAAKLNISVLLGSSGKAGDSYINYVLIINEHGKVLGKYLKTWRAGEPYYMAGKGPVIFTIAGVESTIIICHDLRYPELARLGVAAGAKIIFIANNESGITSENKLLGYRSMQISRATENKVFAVMSNSPADPRDINRNNCSHGNSKIVDPLGNVLDEAGVFEERLVVSTLDMEMASGSTVTRVLGKNEKINQMYGTTLENAEYIKWMNEGLNLVQRLEGQGVESYLKK